MSLVLSSLHPINSFEFQYSRYVWHIWAIMLQSYIKQWLVYMATSSKQYAKNV